MTQPHCRVIEETTAQMATHDTPSNAKRRAGDRRPMTESHRRFYWPLVLIAGLTVGIISATAKRGSNSSIDDDKKTVAALDAEYQAAVKINDASTMNRILADDFILVTGSGKSLYQSRHGQRGKRCEPQLLTER